MLMSNWLEATPRLIMAAKKSHVSKMVLEGQRSRWVPDCTVRLVHVVNPVCLLPIHGSMRKMVNARAVTMYP